MEAAPSQSIFFGLGDLTQYSGGALSRQASLRLKRWFRDCACFRSAREKQAQLK
jgi:hypothetical protein